MKLLNKATRKLGIEFNDEQLKLVEIEKGKRNTTITNIAIERIPQGLIHQGEVLDEETFLSFLKSFFKQLKLKSKETHISISCHNILLRPLHMNHVPEKALRKAIQLEIENTIQLPYNEYVFDFTIIQDNDQQYPDHNLDLMLVIAPKKVVSAYANLLEKCGLSVKSIDLTPIAILRLIEWEEMTKINEPFMIVNMNEQFVEVSILNQRIIRLNRYVLIDLNSYMLDSRNPEMNSIQFDFDRYIADLTREIERILNFYLYTLNNRDQVLKEIIVVGNQNLINAMIENLTQTLQIPARSHIVRRFMLPNYITEGVLDQYAPLITGALGLALKEVKP
jgi:type IV pilus assembly protein PilM